eukprot:9193907-Ditylum_brightwellii.AAC.1
MTEQQNEMPNICMRCKDSPKTMWSVPCGCYGVCRKCAMKMATGGRCKTCKEFFTGFGSSAPSEADDGDSDIDAEDR